MTATASRPLRVGFNARNLAGADLRGWNRYTLNLLAALPEVGVTPVLYSDRPFHPAHLERLPAGSFTVEVGAVRPYGIWEQRWLPRRCGRDRVDLLHAPANFGLPWSCPCPRVLTLHDAIDAVYYAPRMRFRERWSVAATRGRFAHWVARTRADRVIAVSEHARGDLVAALGMPPEKIRVVPEAADPALLRPRDEAERARVRTKHGLDRPYVFYVGGWEGRKNLPFLVRAFAESMAGDAVDLVLAGGRDDQRGGLEALAGTLGLEKRIRLLGWVVDDDLPSLYAGALCFAYPSEYEGFGLQICEALALGRPVLAARASCLPEVLGDGGEMFGLDDVGELAGLLRRLVHDPAFRDDLSKRSRARSAAFSWRKTAEATAEVYRELIDAKPRGGRSSCASAARF